MQGQIIAHGEKAWLVRVYLGQDPHTGKRKYEGHMVHGPKKDAQTWLNAKLRELDMGNYAGVSHTLMNSLFDALLADYRINGKRHDWADLVVRVHLRPFFGALKASKISTDLIRRYIANRQKSHSRKTESGQLREYGPAANATVNRELALLRRSFTLGRLDTPPKVATVPFIPMLQENNARKGFFEHPAFLAVRSALPEEIRPVISFAYFTGCKKGEILALEWPQVDLGERSVRLEETKNGEPRTIPLVPELYEILKLQPETRDRYWPGSP